MKSWISEHTRLMISRQGYASEGMCLILLGDWEEYDGIIVKMEQAG